MTAGALGKAVFEAFSRNGGNPPECHFDRNAAEQWMAEALQEVGVSDLIERGEYLCRTGEGMIAFRAALARVGGAR